MVLNKNYPSDDNLYGDVFVHTRVKEYLQHADVKVISFFRDLDDYTFEGVSVAHAVSTEALLREYESYMPDALFIHFYHRELFPFIQQVKKPVIIWVHGYEALGWYRRLYDYTWKTLLGHLPDNIRQNLTQMYAFRKLIRYSNTTGMVKFVFVSKWMKRICESDSFFSQIKYFYVIPNPINCIRFSYTTKNLELRKRILLIRSFDSKKYATDVAVDAICKLSSKPYFPDLHFALYGNGYLFDRITEPVKHFSNVELHKKFVPNEEIAAIHKHYGLFLCPTRQDAQGVSMCEAMASGLVPLTTNCTAIPEFVEQMRSGWLTNSSSELAEAIDALYKDPALFSRLSQQAAVSITEQCDIKFVTSRELNIVS